MRFEGRVAVVTGAAQGIGAACAERLAKEGARVFSLDLQGAQIACDVTDEAALSRAFERIGRVDVAVNAAGVEGAMARTGDADAEDFARVVDVDLRGVFLSIRAELRAGATSIVNVASVAGLAGWHGAAAYSAAKHGVVGLTRTAALEYARKGIRVNAVCPGVTQTPMYDRMLAQNPRLAERTVAANPTGRVARADEVAAAALWLLSDEASFVNGVALPVDGGLLAQ